MEAVHFSVATNKELPAHEAHMSGHVVGFTSWRRLAEIFQAAGELKGAEKISAFQVDERGITFRIAST